VGERRLPAIVLAIAAAVATCCTGASAAAPGPPPEAIVTGTPPPPLRGGPEKNVLPCGLAGGLNDGRDFVPAGGTPRAAMIFVDFSDAPEDGSFSPQQLYDGFVPPSRPAFRALSYGKFNGPSVTPLLTWVRLPHPSSAYGFDETPTYDAQHKLLADAVHAADPSFDFSKYSILYVVTAPSVYVRSSADQAENPGNGFKADGNEILHAVSLGTSDDYSRGYDVFVHETNHLLGLDDLYPYSNASDYVGSWDIMSAFAPDPLMTSWNRFLVGWLGKSAFKCVSRPTDASLTAVGARGGLKAVVVRINRQTAYVAEARTDEQGIECQRDGVLLYTVHPGVGSGNGPVRLIDANSSYDCGSHSDATFVPGTPDARYVSPNGRFRLRVLARTSRGFRVRVTVPAPRCRVPALRGKTLAQARRALSAAHCALGKVRRPKGKGGRLVVASQSVRAGASRAHGTKIGVRLVAPPKPGSHSLRRVAATG
jgi:M6 family metalloprotease-like protein